jgi:hypothetical protein
MKPSVRSGGKVWQQERLKSRKPRLKDWGFLFLPFCPSYSG